VASLANLVVSMIADVSKFDTDMQRTAKQNTARMKQMEREAQAAGKALGVAFAAVAAATTAVVIKSANAADAIRELSLRTGIGAEALSHYQAMAEMSGVSLEQFTTGIGKMQRSLVEAATGTDAQRAAFERLGLSVSEVLKLSPEEQFQEIAEAISNLGSAAERTAAAQEIFGRAGAALLPVMAQGKAGISAIADEMDRFGATITEGFAARADQFNDNLARLELRAVGLGNAFTDSLLPSLLDIQTAMLGVGPATDTAAKAGEKIGSVLKTLATAFVVVKEAALLWGRVMLGAFTAVLNVTRAIFSPVIGAIEGIGEALLRLSSGDFSGALAAIKDIPQKIGAEFAAAAEQVKLASGFLVEQFTDDIPAAIDRVNKFFNTHAKVVDGAADSLGGFGNEAAIAAKDIKVLEKAAADFIKRAKENKEKVEDNIAAFEEFHDKLQDLRDVGDPVGAMVREFTDKLIFLNGVLANSPGFAEEYRRILNVLSDALGKAAAATIPVAEEFDAMNEAMLEGVRILERTFNDLWTGLLDGSVNAWDGILDGFKALLAQMLHSLISAPLIKALQDVFKEGGGGVKNLDYGAIGTALAGAIGVGLGAILGGGGQGAGIGSGLGSILGKAAGKSLLGSLGSFAGPIGTVIGGILGGLLGGLFDSSRPSIFEASGSSNAGASGSDDDTFADSAFGRTFIRSRRLDAAAINEFKAALGEFDKTIASFLDDSQIATITTALSDWTKKIEGEVLTAEQLLGSRFDAILSTFSDDLRQFVNGAEALEERIARLQVGVGAEKLFADNGDLFGSHTVAEFLAVVEAFKDGTESITDAFNEVLQLLDAISTVKSSLKDFGSSNLGADFAKLMQLQSESVVDTLTRLTSSLADAITNFDGSPEQLVEIGNLALSVRQQELTALSLIDSVAKGLNASLERLRSDVNATINGPRAAEDVLFDARALIGTVSQAQTPEDIARIGQEFEALIRSLSPEDTKAFGTTINALIDSFQAVSAESASRIHQAILDSGADIRAMAAGFADLIDPIQVIADSNEKAAIALESIASGQAVITTQTVQQVQAGDTVGQSDAIAQSVTDALSDGVDDMAIRLSNAIRTGFAGANVSVNVIVQDSGLVTQ